MARSVARAVAAVWVFALIPWGGGCVSPDPRSARLEAWRDAMERGREGVAVEDYAAAERAFTEATRLEPAEPAGWVALADALERGRLKPREALVAYQRARGVAGEAAVASRVQAALRAFSVALAEDARRGGVDAQLALEALVAASRGERDPKERATLRELALEVEARALARALLPALQAAWLAGLGDAVAVLPPEWLAAARPAGRSLTRLGELLAGALSERRETSWRVRSPAESLERARRAGGQAPRHADVHDPTRRGALADALEARLVILLQGGQRVSARLVALGSGDVVPRGHAAVFHPSDDAFALAPPAGPPLEAEVRLLARRRLPGGVEEEVLVTDGAVLRSGDKVRIHVRPSQQAHVLALWFDSRERVTRLFPGTSELLPGAPPLPANPIRRGDELIVPGPAHGFTLDEETGVETLYVVVTREPLHEDDAGGLALALAQGAGDPDGALRAWLEERAGALTSAAATADEAATLIRGHGALVRAVWFRHE